MTCYGQLVDLMNIPTRTTPRLFLRPFGLSDAEALHRILSQPGVLLYFPNQTPPELGRVERMINFQLEHWQLHGFGWWAIEDKETSRFIGWSGLQFLPETDEVEIAYLLDRDSWGRGLATEAARSGLMFGFDQTGQDEIVGIVHPDNIGSKRVLEKLGLQFTDRKIYFGMDCMRYSLAAAEFQNQRKQQEENV